MEIQKATKTKLSFPMIGDPEQKVIALYDMLAANVTADSPRNAGPSHTTVRSVVVIAPDKRIILKLAYPEETARNFDEVLRVVDSVRLTRLYKAKAFAGRGEATSGNG